MKLPADRSFPADNPAAGQAAEPEGAAAAVAPAAGGVARDGGNAIAQVAPAASPPVVTGAQLTEELRNAAHQLGLPLATFLAPISGALSANRYLAQLSIAKRPKPETVARIRALIAGQHVDPTLPPHYFDRRNPVSGNAVMRDRAQVVAEETRRKENDARRASELARALRGPGETLADAAKREAVEDGEQRRLARTAGGGVEPIDFRRLAHHPKARKFEPLPPKVWAELRRLADERGEQPMALLPIVVEQGIAALRAA